MVRLMTDGGSSAVDGLSSKGFMPYSNKIISATDYLARAMHEEKLATIKLIPVAMGKHLSYVIYLNMTKAHCCRKVRRSSPHFYRMLEDNMELKATIIGHTDNQGGRAYNQRLSEESCCNPY